MAERTEWPPGRGVPPDAHPGATTTTDDAAALTTSAGRRRHVIARYWTIACLDRLCVNCGCGRSLEPDLGREAADPDDYDPTA